MMLIPRFRRGDAMLPGLAFLAATASCNHDPTVITLAQPLWPASASPHGSVTVAVTLDAEGKVAAASVFQSSGDPAVDAAAVDAAKQSTYAPGATNCAPSGGTFGVQFQYG